MNIKTTFPAIALAALFISGSALGHEPSKHTATTEKPNCEAMHKMDSAKMDMSDPVMQAMMKQCGKPDMEDHHDKQDEKPVCTEEHAKLGQCTLAADASDHKQTETSSDLPPIVLKNTLPPIGHDAPMDPSAPPHERADHRKVYEVPDCEDMSKMHHGALDEFDPIIKELMKKCEDADETESESLPEESGDGARSSEND